MRQKLNENPLVQVAVIGVLALLVGGLLLMRMGSGSGSDSSTPATTTPAADTAATGTDPAAASADSAASADPEATADSTAATDATTAAPATGADTATAAAASGFVAGPGLPADVVNAWDDGKAVVLLIVRKGGIDDGEVKRMVEHLRSRSDTAVFVVETRDIADYSRIAQGVDLDRVPALVVLRPKGLTKGPMPEATVSYGFRGQASVDQALEDALYKGPDDLPYSPR